MLSDWGYGPQDFGSFPDDAAPTPSLMWHTTDAELCNCEAGERAVVVVTERPAAGQPLTPRLVILEATETGWRCDDDTYTGYTPMDGDRWAWERDVIAASL